MNFILVFGESAGIPIPGETALLLGSAIAGAGTGLNIYRIVVTGVLAAFLGDNAGYFIGRRKGKQLIDRMQRRFGFSAALVGKGETLYSRYGIEAVIAGRFIAFLRVLTPIYAGISGMNPITFVAADALGGILWVVTICFLGHAFGSNIALVEKLVRETRWVILGVLAVAGIILLVRQRIRRS